MPKFTQVAPVAVRQIDPETQLPREIVVVYALGDDGKVYRKFESVSSGWQVVE